MTKATRPRTELQELVDEPNETLAIEYKSWLDLNEATVRADLARHIAALANYGGGSIVLGINDEMKFAGQNPYPKVVCDRDLVASIVKKYLEPTFQCDVIVVSSAAGNEHPIITVPPHGATPICAKASGPLVNGKSSGIVQACYYTRKPGPESAPVLTAAEWAPIIRRCSLHERTSILGAIDTALRGVEVVPKDNLLKKWHDAAHAVFLRDVNAHTDPSRQIAKRHFQFSYAIDHGNSPELAPQDLLEILRQVGLEVHDLVHIGWSMFHPFTRPGIMPFFQTDTASGQGDKDFLETALLRDTEKGASMGSQVDMWRVAPDGYATIIQQYWEDRVDLNQQFNLKPGTWLSPNKLVRDIAELVRHAHGLAARFDSPASIAFRCEWFGLGGREIHDPWRPWSPGHVARSDHRIVSLTFPLLTLVNDWPEVVAKISSPVIRLFRTDLEITPGWVRGQSVGWRNL